MTEFTGFATPGTRLALRCPRCGDPCGDPQGHLPTSYNATELLLPDDLVRLYGEVSKWGRRWRVMKVLKDSIGKVNKDIHNGDWEDIWKLAQELGLGAGRSQGFGRFDVIQWTKGGEESDA